MAHGPRCRCAECRATHCGAYSHLTHTEETCPGHVAGFDPNVCKHCGTHVDEMRPEEIETD